MTTTQDFQGAHLRWPFDRRQRPFVVRVMEPAKYRPVDHAEIFNAAVTSLVERSRRTVDLYDRSSHPADPRQFDLITFPEAFIDGTTLCATLSIFQYLGPSGCIHTGLRASAADASRHLFKFDEMVKLRDELEALLPFAEVDLGPFSTWLDEQDQDGMFNLGCIFLNDANSQMRVCLHPKQVRSKFEISHVREEMMCEANLLTVVTLEPADKKFGTITLQPLICSDALHLESDSGREPPIHAVNRDAACLGANPPDHVDIVSVATCTPQPRTNLDPTTTVHSWHEQFRHAFVDAARSPDCTRHHFAAIVLSNFRQIETTKVGGLSGVFLPVPPNPTEFGVGTMTSVWGSASKEEPDTRWSLPGERDFTGWRSRGFIAMLEPANDAIGRIFGFTIHRLPREASPWEKNAARLTSVEIRQGARDDTGVLTFPRRGATHE
ncbi:MAG: hypothetical protein V7676_06785 [Parasphingorhabdus sp.]|uniref:hypothetical protein n=1 Tax=Parasphingorhabdus sp. TaxID=2709688 RepID=UPI00300298E2